MSLSRRALMSGLLASVSTASSAASLRPRLRPADFALGSAPPSAASVLGDSGLSSVTGFSLRDLGNGRVLEEHQPGLPLPPASATKAITTLYAIDALGLDYRYSTVVAAAGPVHDGRVQGDLYLIGGGDPHLDTDGLAELARQVAGAGIFGVTGSAYVLGSALPFHRNIDPGQPEHAGYNPAISGMNLNFNRVHFEWKAIGNGQFSFATTARSKSHDPAVRGVEVRVADRQSPVFAYAQAEGRDLWTVSRQALGKGGARWLPVRAPDLYAAEVFRTIAAGLNVRLPDLRQAQRMPAGLTVVAEVQSAACRPMLRAMMRYSTNLTAEVMGLRAHQAKGGSPATIAESGAAMTQWARRRYGLGRVVFRNHSGLTDTTRISSDEMVQLLDHASAGPLAEIMKPVTVLDQNGNRVDVGKTKLVAKTGTLNFTRALAGYLNTPNGRRMAFAIFASDLKARAGLNSAAEVPRGARRFRNVARRQEQALLRRWIKLYG